LKMEDSVIRRAKLFQAGEFPDKGVTITVETLAGIVQNFDQPVPVWIEHNPNPLKLGVLKSVELKGDELFGTLELTHEANALIEQSEARGLSLGLTPDLKRIREVSLVRNPRIPGARLFREDLVFFDATLGSPDWEQAYTQLFARQQAQEADQRIDQLLKEGRLLPSQVPFARAVLRSGDAIEFDGERQSVAQLMVAMLERQPPHGLFGVISPGGEEATTALFLPEERAFYERYFPGVSLDEIAQRKRAQG